MEYGRLINKCVNLELKRKYELRGYVFIEYCETNRDVPTTNPINNAFLTIVILLLTTTILSTIYDFRLKRMKPLSQQRDHYVSSVPGIGVSFSIQRNWNRLVAEGQNEATQNLHFIQGLRFILMYGVITGHVLLFCSIIPLLNPEYIEIVSIALILSIPLVFFPLIFMIFPFKRM